MTDGGEPSAKERLENIILIAVYNSMITYLKKLFNIYTGKNQQNYNADLCIVTFVVKKLLCFFIQKTFQGRIFIRLGQNQLA